MPSLVVLTVITPSYERVGREMVKRVKRFTGHDVKVIEVPDEQGFEAKLTLDRHAGKRRALFLDADIWPLREWNPDETILGNCVQGCWDHATTNPHAFPHTDCHKNGLDWQTYLNTGFLAWGNHLAEHRELFKVARQSWKDQKRGKKHYVDKTDQAHLVHGIQTLNLRVQLLPIQYNCYLFGIFHGQFPFIPRDIINLHGAGIPAKHKYGRLKAQASVLGQKMWPMHQMAVNLEHVRQYQFR